MRDRFTITVALAAAFFIWDCDGKTVKALHKQDTHSCLPCVSIDGKTIGARLVNQVYLRPKGS